MDGTEPGQTDEEKGCSAAVRDRDVMRCGKPMTEKRSEATAKQQRSDRSKAVRSAGEGLSSDVL